MVGRNCLHCDRPVAAKEMCMRHYQMWRKHGDPLYSDKRKVGNMPPGTHLRRGYIAVCGSGPLVFSVERTSAKTTRKDHVSRMAVDAQGKRGNGTRQRILEHRKIAGAKRGEIVHHIDGNKQNNDPDNLHIFKSQSLHTKSHKSLEAIGFELLLRGIIVFNRHSGLYELAQSDDQDT